MIATRPTRTVRRFALLAAALTTTACQGTDGPAAPLADRCPSARVPLCMDVAHAALVRAAVADAGSRLAPSLEDAALRAPLTASLATLSDALLAGDIARARSSLAATRAALAQGRAAATDAADITAIEITLEETADALAGS
jgi:hypothetical protein